LRELRFLLSLQHNNIVNCHALEHTRIRRYLVLDYCEGGSLRNLIEKEIRLHPIQSLKLIADVLAGLDHAHSRGIIHCDIKPENILLTVQANGWKAHISDFGIARLKQEVSDVGMSNTGSPAYMAPERFYGQYSPSSDIYAVGILLFELLTGYRPFSGTPSDLMSAHLNHTVQVSDAISPILKNIILTALQKLPARRFRSASRMLTEVQMAIEGLKSELGEERAFSQMLQVTVNLPVCPFKALREETLQAEVRQLVGRSQLSQPPVQNELNKQFRAENPAQKESGVEGEWIYQVFGNSVGSQTYPRGALQHETEKASLVTVRLPEPVKQLVTCAQGCYVVTQRSVYLVSTELFQFGVQNGHLRSLQKESEEIRTQRRVPQLVAEFRQDFEAAIDPLGKWMATTGSEQAADCSLLIWNLAQMQPIKAIPRCLTHLFQLMPLDSRHIAAFSHTVDSQSSACITGASIEVFTRRGSAVGSLNLPVPLRCLTASQTPYQLIGMEPAHPNSMLLIDLKPLRISRIGVEISPVLIEAAVWGYVLVDVNGQIVLLDRYGEGVGRIEGPANPTAIALPNPYGLLIATWKNGQGSLYTLDLRQLDLELVF
jgi:serine/threonine-protein kinase